MKRILYYFLMTLGVACILSGVFLFIKGANFNGYFYPLFIGTVLIGTTYFNHQQKNNT